MTSKRCRRRRRRACRLAGEGEAALRTDRTISSGEAVALILLPPAVHAPPREPAINAHAARQTPVETVFWQHRGGAADESAYQAPRARLNQEPRHDLPGQSPPRYRA